MKQNRFHLLGWLVAAGLFGVMLAGGFQPAAEKIGVVDMTRVIQQSEAGKRRTAEFDARRDALNGILDFMFTHRVLTVDQAQRLRTLSLKADITAAEKAELDKLKADVVEAAKRFNDLNQKASPTDEERALLQDFNQRQRNIGALIQQWQTEFEAQLSQQEAQIRTDMIQRARTAVQGSAKSQGYTLVFESQVAIYGANDLTDQAIQAMNAAGN